MADYLTTDTELTSVANAIRTKGGTSASLVYPTGFVSAIQNIPSGGTDVSDTTATASDVRTGKYFYTANGTKTQGTIVTKNGSDLTASGKTVTVPAGYYASQATKDVATGSATTPATTITANPSISVSSSGLITATNSKTQSVTPTVSAGYVASGTAGTITVSGSNTSQLTTQAAQTITPTTTDQTISSGKYLTGTQTIKGDANLVAGNIKKDVQIFGVTGTHEGGGGGSSVFHEYVGQFDGQNYIWFDIRDSLPESTFTDVNPPTIIMCTYENSYPFYFYYATDVFPDGMLVLIGTDTDFSGFQGIQGEYYTQNGIITDIMVDISNLYDGSVFADTDIRLIVIDRRVS